ncbi:MAG: hypothetical protein EOR56_29530 [Mesorhizobium sp.]|nr:MAG: hypothetical protein EOR54_28595 [Mesorhizobium sp.]RWL05541.1 MAG: hypothetical protein EOR56_29530 [Mesorhizobium sp.]
MQMRTRPIPQQSWASRDRKLRATRPKRNLQSRPYCMSRKSVQRFCDNDMHENNNLKRVA